MASSLLFFLISSVGASKPHIIFNLVDDNGWAGVGYNNPCLSLSHATQTISNQFIRRSLQHHVMADLNTPTLDALAKGGLKLTSHYGKPFFCLSNDQC